MENEPRICVLIPVYNHGLTVGDVAARASRFLPVIAVNDGSTDQTANALSKLSGINIVTFPFNKGKGAALRAGFTRASEMGFTHAITIDADGQHSAEAIPGFVAACRANPAALIVGVRDLVKANAPKGRRFSNALSTFWFKFETGVELADTQCGYRCYPLSSVLKLRLNAAGYAYELEVMVKAAWAGIPLVSTPVEADYSACTSRLSHFRPCADMARMSWLHSKLCTQSVCVPATLRKVSALGQFQERSFSEKVRITLRHLFSEHADTPALLAAAVSLGLFFGIAPLWGFQIMIVVALTHKLRLNKALAVTASNISIPPFAPFIMAAGLIIGHFLWSGNLVKVDLESVRKSVPLYLWEFILGSFVLALATALIGGSLTWCIARMLRSKRDKAQKT